VILGTSISLALPENVSV